MENEGIKQILEAALLVAGRPLALGDLEGLFGDDGDAPPRDAIRRALAELATDCEERSVELREVASGFRLQVREEFAPWIGRLWEEKPPRYSRALLETLAIIAYRQPVTRPEIEDIRGVSVSTQIMRTLQERRWVRVVGHRDSPGQPALYGTTREFLDHFNLKTLDQLPPLAEIRDLDQRHPELALEGAESTEASAAVGGEVAVAPADRARGEDATVGGPSTEAAPLPGDAPETGDNDGAMEPDSRAEGDGERSAEVPTDSRTGAGREGG